MSPILETVSEFATEPWAADVRVAQGLIACLNINLAASRLAVIKDDRMIDRPYSPISVSE